MLTDYSPSLPEGGVGWDEIGSNEAVLHSMESTCGTPCHKKQWM